jgi:hypothetical protein
MFDHGDKHKCLGDIPGGFFVILFYGAIFVYLVWYRFTH